MVLGALLVLAGLGLLAEQSSPKWSERGVSHLHVNYDCNCWLHSSAMIVA